MAALVLRAHSAKLTKKGHGRGLCTPSHCNFNATVLIFRLGASLEASQSIIRSHTLVSDSTRRTYCTLVGTPYCVRILSPIGQSTEAGASVLTDRRWIAEWRPALPCRVGSFFTRLLAKRRRTLFLVSVDRPESRRVCQAVTTRSRSASRQLLREPVPLTREFTVQQLCAGDEGYMSPTLYATASAYNYRGPSRIR